jgi:PAS domain S-box-containing protein
VHAPLGDTQLVDLLPDMMCQFEPSGTLLWVNQSYASRHGHTKESLIGLSFLDLVDDSVRPFVEGHLAVLSQLEIGNTSIVHEHPSWTSGGMTSWQEWTDRAIFDGRGRIVSFVSIGRDISKRRDLRNRTAAKVAEVTEEARRLPTLLGADEVTFGDLSAMLDELAILVQSDRV